MIGYCRRNELNSSPNAILTLIIVNYTSPTFSLPTNSHIFSISLSTDERAHEAGRTELYICSQSNCSQTSRFPRYNAVCKVLETRRGRCGEYSVLLMRMLDLLGYQARWTVDWADHVWCEVKVEDQWIHMDPCEASVNEPLIYEEWGKNQTYILSYSDTDVEDVTAKYTTKFNETLLRRQDDDVNTTFIEERLVGIRKQLREKEDIGLVPSVPTS